jgi:O-antigen ligase
VGIQGYAFALPVYVDPFIETFFDWETRRIANNIYVELLAEQGVIGLAAMALVLYSITRRTFRRARTNAVLCAGVLAVLFSWLAFPTYTISFHWVGLALIHRLAVQGVVSKTPKRAKEPDQAFQPG